MTYRSACYEPDFRQDVPQGNWTRIPDPMFSGSYRYRNDDTGETVLVPAIWYNGTAEERASYLVFCAERSDEGAKRIEAEGKPWSARDAARFREQAVRLRTIAGVYAASGKAIAGHVERHS